MQLLQQWGISLDAVSSEQEIIELPDIIRQFLHESLSGLKQRKELKRSWAALNERLIMLSEASFEGILIHEDGVVLEVNERLAQMLGYEKSELLGPNVIQKCVAQQDQPRVYQLMRSGYEGSYMITGARKDKTTFLAELQSKQGRLGSRPVRVAAVRDVTQRELMLKLLRESETQLQDLAASIFDLTVLSRDGIILSIRGPMLAELAYTEKDFVGQPILKFVAPAALPLARDRIGRSSTGAYQSIFVDRNGHHVPVEIVGAVTSLDGQPVRIAGVRDLRGELQLEAERRSLQKHVEQSTRLDSLGVLAGGIAHDFNNLLMSILGNAEMMADKISDPELAHMFGSIVTAAEQASQLTQRLLSYAGRGEIGPPEKVAIDRLIDEIAMGLAQYRRKAAGFTLDLSAACSVMGDRASLAQVLMNLMTNARDAVADGGEIRIRTSRVTEPDQRWDEALGAVVGPGKWVLIEIEDSGAGMDEVTLSRIFEPFFTTKETGHGLGLAACLGIVKSHDGALHVRSAVGHGTLFSVLLPAAVDLGEEQAKPSFDEADACRVLVVDDEAMIRKQMERSLRLRGFRVREADCGQSCLDAVVGDPPDVILLDMTMPDMSGDEVMRRLRAIGIQVPVVLTSGALDPESEKDLEADSFQAFLRKPYGVEELVRTISEVRDLGRRTNA